MEVGWVRAGFRRSPRRGSRLAGLPRTRLCRPRSLAGIQGRRTTWAIDRLRSREFGCRFRPHQRPPSSIGCQPRSESAVDRTPYSDRVFVRRTSTLGRCRRNPIGLDAGRQRKQGSRLLRRSRTTHLCNWHRVLRTDSMRSSWMVGIGWPCGRWMSAPREGWPWVKLTPVMSQPSQTSPLMPKTGLR